MTITDTHPEAAAVQAAILKAAGGVGRLRRAFEASDLARKLAFARLEQAHPEFTQAELVRAFLEQQGCRDLPPIVRS